MSKEEFDSAVEFYLKEHGMFMHDFFEAGNTELKIEIEPRANVASGLWYEATWKTAKGEKRYVSSMRRHLTWERIIKQYLSDGEANRDVQESEGGG